MAKISNTPVGYPFDFFPPGTVIAHLNYPQSGPFLTTRHMLTGERAVVHLRTGVAFIPLDGPRFIKAPPTSLENE